MYDPYTIKELDLDRIIEQLEDSDYPLDDDILIDEIFGQGNLWAANPEEIAIAVEDFPQLERLIKS
ncbi:hypothetical protein [Paraglaciecola marina]|uniref:hypothetical protein n=1 Tax=Paraglaciecola marina TaxID=2500157 RepID=UPI00105D9056|nr:hypothetical protein [Paraglaciecola marina]